MLIANSVTPAMAYQFIKVRLAASAIPTELTPAQSLKAEDIDYVVAPYEADAQLAFLARKGLVDAIISEDSDLVVYGCPVILFKLDPAGSVIEYRRDRLTTCAEYSFHHWTDDRLRQCVPLLLSSGREGTQCTAWPSSAAATTLTVCQD